MSITESDYDAITELYSQACDETSRVQLAQVHLAEAFEVSQSTISMVVNAEFYEELGK